MKICLHLPLMSVLFINSMTLFSHSNTRQLYAEAVFLLICHFHVALFRLTEAGPGFFYFLECSHICFFPPYCLIIPNLSHTSPHNPHLFYQSSLLLPLLPSVNFSFFSFHRIYHSISPDTVVALVCNTHGQSCLVDCGRQADVCEEGVCALEVLPVPLRCEREPSRLRLLGLR